MTDQFPNNLWSAWRNWQTHRFAGNYRIRLCAIVASSGSSPDALTTFKSEKRSEFAGCARRKMSAILTPDLAQQEITLSGSIPDSLTTFMRARLTAEEALHEPDACNAGGSTPPPAPIIRNRIQGAVLNASVDEQPLQNGSRVFYVRRRARTPERGGSAANTKLGANPSLTPGPVAQWLEQSTHNALVLGSSPSRPTISGNNLYSRSLHRATSPSFRFRRGSRLARGHITAAVRQLQ